MREPSPAASITRFMRIKKEHENHMIFHVLVKGESAILPHREARGMFCRCGDLRV